MLLANGFLRAIQTIAEYKCTPPHDVVTSQSCANRARFRDQMHRQIFKFFTGMCYMMGMGHDNRLLLDRRTLLAGGAAAMLAPVPAVAAAFDEAHIRMIAHRELARAKDWIWLRDTVGLADFTRPSWEPRFFIVDMLGGKVRPFLVTHGKGSDPAHEGHLQIFSNQPNSEATSRGAYITHTWYEGKYGTSLRLSGLEPDNNMAESRAIVCHGAWYANPDMIGKWGKLGRSEGCFAFPEANLMEIIARLGPGRLLFADKL